MADTSKLFLGANEQAPRQEEVFGKGLASFHQWSKEILLVNYSRGKAVRLRPDAHPAYSEHGAVLSRAPHARGVGLPTLTWKEYASTSAPTIPSELRYLEAPIERSREILSWEDDWDGEGSPGYAQATWDRAIAFVICNAMRLYSLQGVRVVAPDVWPGPDGSIDIRWQNKGRDLLINVPVEEGEPATFHGDDNDNNVVKGHLNLSARNDWLLMWLMEQA